jgi:hypothetical protein
MDNVLLTPHVRGSTEVALPERSAKHRMLHMHRIQPGVFSTSLKVKRKLEEVPGTIRTRILY